jgi:hypothetical protein
LRYATIGPVSTRSIRLADLGADELPGSRSQIDGRPVERPQNFETGAARTYEPKGVLAKLIDLGPVPAGR